LEKEDKTRHNPVEPDARMMRVEEGRERWAYNAQAAVDKDSGMVVAETVTNEEVDFHQLVPMLERVEENLGETAEETVADAGYRSKEQLGEAYKRGYEVLTSPHGDEIPKEDQFHASEFTYDKENDCCICPVGTVLNYAGTDKSRGERVYYCREWAKCPSRDRCTRAKRGRKIKISPHHEAVVHQRKKRKQPEKQEALRRRKVIVEPVFGWIKQCMGFRRWTVKGLANVQAQWALLCLTVNLKKLLPHWLEGRLALV
jgi:IS5 family transposase